MTDLEIITAVDELARQFVNLSAPFEVLIAPGAQMHRSHTGFVRRLWEQARQVYIMRTGIDVLDAIKRHEAWLRSAENAPELYVERR